MSALDPSVALKEFAPSRWKWIRIYGDGLQGALSGKWDWRLLVCRVWWSCSEGAGFLRVDRG